IQATEGVTVGGFLLSRVRDTGVGDSGGITIDTSTLTLEKGGIIDASTFGKGDAGKIEIQATEGVNVRGWLSSDVKGTAQGNSGGITIDTSTLTLEKGGFIDASTFGKGDAGNIAIKATQGVNVGGFLFSRVNDTAVGNSGGITIDTSTLTLEKGGFIDASKSGKGNAGNIAIRATEGVNVGGFLFSGVTDTGEGNSGGITINTATLTLENGGYIGADTSGKGNAGNIAIRATEGVNVGGVLSSGVFDTGVGDSGGITIDTSTLTLENDGIISTSILGKGDAGNITINATQGVTVGGLLTSGVFSTIETIDRNSGGKITINTATLTVENNGGSINTDTHGKGDAGNIAIQASQGVNVRGRLTSDVKDTAQVNSGGITIDTANLTVENGGRITALTSGKGNAGNVVIKATQGVTVGGSLSSGVTDTGVGDSGDITIDTSTLTVENGGFIHANTFGKGNAGNIAIKATQGVNVGGFLTSAVFDTGEGNGGSITIDTSTLTLKNDGFISTSTYGKGNAGDIAIEATQGVTIGGFLSSGVTDTGVGDSGDITIDTSTLTVENGGFINADTFGKGNAGNIAIKASEGVNVGGQLTSDVKDTAQGNSGGITIDTSTLTLKNGGRITASTFGQGNAGNIAIKATQGVNVGGFLFSRVTATGEGNSGGITIDTSTLTLENGGLINADTSGKGNAGKIEIQATEGVTVGGFLFSRVTDTGEGNSGGITIDTSTLTLENDGII
ncbi:MAG: beta strand repeat-containing protein, partial [Microcystis panniformis]